MDVETNSNDEEEQDLIQRTRIAKAISGDPTMKYQRPRSIRFERKALLVMGLMGGVTMCISLYFISTKVIQQLSYNQELQQMIDSTDNVIITMPAKAAGTSLKLFAQQCFNGSVYWDAGHAGSESNFLNFIKKNGAKDLTDSYELPRVMASHMYTPENFIHIIKNVPSQTLMIHSHREATDRLLSAIKEVLTDMCVGKNLWGTIINPPRSDFFSKQDKATNTCYVAETKLIELVIKPRKNEIGVDSTRLLTCNFYDALEKNAPNFLFMDFKKADKLMDRLAEKYCSHLVAEPVKGNVGDDKPISVLVEVPNKQSGVVDNVSLKEWMNTKRLYIELMLGTNNDASCRAKTRVMEKMLFASDGFVNAADVLREVG